MATGSKILALEYNNIQTKINSVMGVGSGQLGYGQSLASSQVSIGAKISANQWNNLRSDIARATQYQTGASSLSTVPTGNKIIDTYITDYDTAATSAVSNANLSTLPLVSQSSLTTWDTSTRTTSWRTSVTHTITATFASTNAIRNFFNCGCSVKIYASRTGGTTSSTKNTTWSTMLTNMGTITFNNTSVTRTGTGTAYTNGFISITSTDQLIFQKMTETPLYSPNQYDIYARISGTAIIFTIVFSDLSTGATEATYLGTSPTWRVDDLIDGTLVSTVQAITATGTNVTSPIPTITVSFTGS